MKYAKIVKNSLLLRYYQSILDIAKGTSRSVKTVGRCMIKTIRISTLNNSIKPKLVPTVWRRLKL